MITAQELRSRAEDADAKAVAAHDEVVRHAYQEIARHWRELAEEAEKYRHSEK